jgi:glycosyltransferase involved in cell wall biosynthesis
MHKLSVIILSYAIDNEVYEVNCRCLDSLRASEEWQNGELEIVLIESNKKNPYTYGSDVKVVIPNEKFNFHRFLNIGVNKSDGEFVALCNNDIIFEKNWWSEIMKVKHANPKFMCFSPLDRSYPMMSEEAMPSSKRYYIGWENKKHFAAWCFVWERKVFDIVGKFDETFDFYSADDDELMTLRKYAIPNVLVTASEVKHISQVVTKKDGISKHKVVDIEKYPLSEKEIKRGLTWLWDDVRFYVAWRRMENKYGNERMLRRLNRVFEKHPILFRPFITKFCYSKTIVNILAKLTGI